MTKSVGGHLRLSVYPFKVHPASSLSRMSEEGIEKIDYCSDRHGFACDMLLRESARDMAVIRDLQKIIFFFPHIAPITLEFPALRSTFP